MTLPQKPKTLEEAWQIIIMLVKRNNELEARIKELEGCLQKNSHNSSKPPSSDGLSKPPRTQSLREPSFRPAGGQPGHSGNHLALVDNPDGVVRHSVSHCQRCHRPLSEVTSRIERRQVFDLPPFKIQVTEHQREIKECPDCGHENRADFPAEVSGITSYGSRLQSLALYFMHYQFIPYERCQEMFNDLFSLPLSTGTLWDINQRTDRNLRLVYQEICDRISHAEVAHFDETGMRVEGKLHWLHTASTEQFTAYGLYQSRGQKGMEALGILPKFRGCAVHDHLASYFDYTGCDHALCNAHHLRELTFVAEQEKEVWAAGMKLLLKEIYQKIEETKQSGKKRLSFTIRNQYENDYDRIINQGLRYHRGLAPVRSIGSRGRKKQRQGKNLLDRLRGRRDETLLFMHNFAIPFTNNLGERDIRMSKVKEKISGCFRSTTGADIFCRIRSYLSTTRKQGGNILDALLSATQGLPRLPTLTSA